MEDTTGPMRYITCMMFEQHINYRLEKAREKVERYYINPSSYLAKYVINNNSQPFILREVEKSIVNLQGKSWEKLPKIIWIYWDKGIENSSLGNKLCVDNIRRTAAHTKFQVKQLNDSNIEKYLGKELNDKINNFIKNAKIQIFPQTRSDFARIAIIAKYGGIYMDASYFAVDGFQWIINISQAPSEMIFNRYGELPRVLTFIHPHFGNAFDWTYDKQANTKKLMVSAYESNLLIAQPNQQIFWDWLEEHGKFITTPYE